MTEITLENLTVALHATDETSQDLYSPPENDRICRERAKRMFEILTELAQNRRELTETASK